MWACVTDIRADYTLLASLANDQDNISTSTNTHAVYVVETSHLEDVAFSKQKSLPVHDV